MLERGCIFAASFYFEARLAKIYRCNLILCDCLLLPCLKILNGAGVCLQFIATNDNDIGDFFSLGVFELFIKLRLLMIDLAADVSVSQLLH